MKSQTLKLCFLVALAYYAFPCPGRCADTTPPDPSYPFGPSGMWFFNGLGWKLGDRSNYAVHLLVDPPLTYEGAEPIGVSIVRVGSSIGEAEGRALPAPKPCAFEGLVWTLVDQFGYSARAVLGPDESLVGFSFRVWNNSRRHPLVIIRWSERTLFQTNIRVDEMDLTERRPKDAGKEQGDGKPVEWTLKPREKKEFFLPLRDFLPEGFDPKDGKACHFSVGVNIHPKNEPQAMEPQYPGVSGIEARITKTGLAMDPQEAFKEAEKNTPALFKKK